MATKFYVRYTPVRSGLTGMEKLPQYLDKYYPGVTYTGVVKDGLVEYGYIEGSGDLFSKAIQTCSEKFSIKRIYEKEFIGFCYPLYNPTPDEDGEEPPSFSEMMEKHGITVPDDVLPNVKAAKKEEFKEIVKREFYEWNDSIAEVSKTAMLFSLYSDDDFTTEQVEKKDDLVSRMKDVYTPELCLKGLENLVYLLEEVLAPYYEAKDEVDDAEDVDSALDVVYK